MKKGIKILISIVTILIVCYGIIFAIDYFRVSNLKEPIFVISKVTADDGGSGSYYGLGYKVEVEKYISAEYGVILQKTEMYIFDKFIVGAVADTNYNEENNLDVNNIDKNFRGIIVKSNLKYIEVEPIEDKDKQILSDKVHISLGDKNDMVYMEGTEVLISYTGSVMETYPTKIDVTKIQLEEQYKTDIKKLPKDYTLNEAIRDNCVIQIHGTTIYNKDELDRFVDNVNNNRFDFMRCINYTIEGDMIIVDIKHEGNNSFRVCLDNTRDKFSSNENRTYKNYRFSKFEMKETDSYIGYYANNPLEGDIDELHITGYSKDVKIINNYDINYLLTPTLSNKFEPVKITTGKLDNMYDYDIYYYGFDSVKIDIANSKFDLKEALESEKVTMEQILQQAKRDSENGIIYSEMYKDGGTATYNYRNYIITKFNIINGSKDLYIGVPEMTYNSVNKN